MTERLFDIDSYISEFDAEVLSCEKVGGGYEAVLDRTAFFPEGGGQSSDSGTVAGANVLHVSERSGVIIHLVDKALEVGESVHGKLVFAERFRRMQNHSAEHIMSGVAHRELGCENVGFHLSEKYIRVDYDKVLTPENIAFLERRVNEKIWQNLAIRAWYPSAEELENTEYRSKKEIDGAIRLVEIEDTDVCACCAPHVRSTGEIGIMKIVDFIKYKGGCRIEAVAGSDAYALFASEHEMLTEIARGASAKREEVPEVFERMKNEISSLNAKAALAEKEKMKNRLSCITETEGNLCFFFESADMNALRDFVNAGVSKCGGVFAAFAGSDASGYRFIAASEKINIKDNCKIINEAVCGKGGGSPQMMQGSASASEQVITEFFTSHNFE